MQLVRLGEPGSERPFVRAGDGTTYELGGLTADIDGGFLARTDAHFPAPRDAQAARMFPFTHTDQTSDVYRSRDRRSRAIAESVAKLIGSVSVHGSGDHGVSPITAGIARVLSPLAPDEGAKGRAWASRRNVPRRAGGRS